MIECTKLWFLKREKEEKKKKKVCKVAANTISWKTAKAFYQVHCQVGHYVA